MLTLLRFVRKTVALETLIVEAGVGVAGAAIGISTFAAKLMSAIVLAIRSFPKLGSELNPMLSELCTLHRVLYAIGNLAAARCQKISDSIYLSNALDDC